MFLSEWILWILAWALLLFVMYRLFVLFNWSSVHCPGCARHVTDVPRRDSSLVPDRDGTVLEHGWTYDRFASVLHEYKRYYLAYHAQACPYKCGWVGGFTHVTGWTKKIRTGKIRPVSRCEECDGRGKWHERRSLSYCCDCEGKGYFED